MREVEHQRVVERRHDREARDVRIVCECVVGRTGQVVCGLRLAGAQLRDRGVGIGDELDVELLDLRRAAEVVVVRGEHDAVAADPAREAVRSIGDRRARR